MYELLIIHLSIRMSRERWRFAVTIIDFFRRIALTWRSGSIGQEVRHGEAGWVTGGSRPRYATFYTNDSLKHRFAACLPFGKTCGFFENRNAVSN